MLPDCENYHINVRVQVVVSPVRVFSHSYFTISLGYTNESCLLPKLSEYFLLYCDKRKLSISLSCELFYKKSNSFNEFFSIIIYSFRFESIQILVSMHKCK